MKKERQVGVRVGIPVFFALELEDEYRHKEGAHRALTFPGFLGLLVGMGLEVYRKGNVMTEATQEDAPEDIKKEEAEPFHLFDMNPERLPDLFREFEEEMKQQESRPRIQLVRVGDMA